MAAAITAEAALRSLYSAAFIGGATLTGGPFGAATATAILASPAGKYAMDQAIAVALGQNATAMATGGMITSPTIALLGEAGPEMVVPLTSPPKRTRKKTDYDRRLKRALLEVNKTARLKNGSFRKGWDQAKVMKKAHKLARKYGPSTKKGQVRKTARRAYKR
jgi:SLT domain-containing protein